MREECYLFVVFGDILDVEDSHGKGLTLVVIPDQITWAVEKKISFQVENGPEEAFISKVEIET